MTTEEEVIAAVTAYVTKHYAGDWTKAFAGIDTNGDGQVSVKELTDFLEELNIGYRLTRPFIANAIMKQLDIDENGFISLAEFKKVLEL